VIGSPVDNPAYLWKCQTSVQYYHHGKFKSGISIYIVYALSNTCIYQNRCCNKTLKIRTDKEKRQTDQQKSTKHNYTTQKTKNRAPRNPLGIGDELVCSRSVSSSYSRCGTHRVTLLTHLVICHERGTKRIVITTNGTYLLSFVTQSATIKF